MHISQRIYLKRKSPYFVPGFKAPNHIENHLVFLQPNVTSYSTIAHSPEMKFLIPHNILRAHIVTNWSTLLLKWHPTEHSILQDVWLAVKNCEIWMKRSSKVNCNLKVWPKLKRRKDGQLVPSDSYILTISSPNIPTQIEIGFLIRNTKVYIPNPQRCFNCQKYGHNKRYCKNAAKCRQAGHDDHECENEAKCANCNGDFPAYVRSCPKWKIENEIIKVKYQKNIPFHEVRQQFEGPVTDPSKTSKIQTLSKLKKKGWPTPLIP